MAEPGSILDKNFSPVLFSYMCALPKNICQLLFSLYSVKKDINFDSWMFGSMFKNFSMDSVTSLWKLYKKLYKVDPIVVQSTYQCFDNLHKFLKKNYTVDMMNKLVKNGGEPTEILKLLNSNELFEFFQKVWIYNSGLYVDQFHKILFQFPILVLFFSNTKVLKWINLSSEWCKLKGILLDDTNGQKMIRYVWSSKNR